MNSLYETPREFNFSLHHVRPRFKDDLEGVILHFADSVAQIGSCERDLFNRRLDEGLHSYPGNATKTKKTIANWRTEISALFSFVQHNGTIESPGRRCTELVEKRNLPEAFRKFLYSFQYPGGHLRPDYAAELIRAGIRFHPAKTILRILRAGNRTGGNSFCLSKSEVCHCIFNDLRVTRDHEDTLKTLIRITENRRNNRRYDEHGDTIRYAGDILDYMQIAGLLKSYNGKDFYINSAATATISKFLAADEWFTAYDSLYKKRNIQASDVAAQQSNWEAFANRELDNALSLAALATPSAPEPTNGTSSLSVSGHSHIPPSRTLHPTAGEIGEQGEALVYGHECMRLKAEGREDLVHLVKRIPTSLAMGFDIASIESHTEQKRYIEVKATTSFKPICFNTFHLTPNEWRVAESERGRYFIYRLFVCLSTGEFRLYTLQDPVGKYKADKITMIPSSSGGVDIRFDSNQVGHFEELLKWHD